MAFGRTVIGRVGSNIQVSVDGVPKYKTGGVTLSWGAVTAAASTYQLTPQGEQSTIDSLESTVANGWLDIVEAGEKFIRHGTVICRIVGGTEDGKFAPYGSTSIGGGALSKARGDVFILNQGVHEVDDSPIAIDGGSVYRHRLVVNFAKSATITIGATGGTFTITYGGQTTSALAFNANAATVEAALVALSSIGTGKATVALSGSTYTITLAQSLAPFTEFTTNAASLTGSTQTATVGDAADTLSGPTQAEFESIFPTVTLVNELNN